MTYTPRAYTPRAIREYLKESSVPCLDCKGSPRAQTHLPSWSSKTKGPGHSGQTVISTEEPQAIMTAEEKRPTAGHGCVCLLVVSLSLAFPPTYTSVKGVTRKEATCYFLQPWGCNSDGFLFTHSFIPESPVPLLQREILSCLNTGIYMYPSQVRCLFFVETNNS